MNFRFRAEQTDTTQRLEQSRAEQTDQNILLKQNRAEQTSSEILPTPDRHKIIKVIKFNAHLV